MGKEDDKNFFADVELKFLNKISKENTYYNKRSFHKCLEKKYFFGKVNFTKKLENKFS